MKYHNLENKLFFSFDKNYSANVKFNKPDKFRELEKLSIIENNLINTGSNLSYSPLSFGKGSTSILLTKFNRIVSFDKQNKEITVEAGMTLSQLLNFTLKYNLWIPQLPGYPFITLGGAIATNAHGKSCAIHGTIRKSIKKILIFHKNNGWLNLSENENKEIYDLTIGGLGLTGTIVNITFNLAEIKNSRFMTRKTKVANNNDCIKFIKKKSIEKNSFIYSWNIADNINDLGKGIIFENIPIQSENKTDKVNIFDNKLGKYLRLNFPIWNKFTVKIANKVFYLINGNLKRQKNIENFTQVIFPFYGKENYFNFFGKKGFFESQLLIPNENLDLFLDEFKYLFKIHYPTITLFSFKNMSGAQKLLRFEDNKICLTIDYTNNKTNRLFMTEIDKICIKYKILPSLIKDSRLQKITFDNCYPNADEFRKKLKLFDKDKIYKSETSLRLGL